MTDRREKEVLFDLNAMQSACFMGRHSSTSASGVASHLYVEFDGQGIDRHKLDDALRRLVEKHAMLRLSVDDEGYQRIHPRTDLKLEIDDLRSCDTAQKTKFLEQKRDKWAHQKLNIREGQGCRFSLSLIDETRVRFHVDTDMIAIDPPSFCLFMEDLASLYTGSERQSATTESYLDWLEKWRTDQRLIALRSRDQKWWRERITTFPAEPKLPPVDVTGAGPLSERYAATIPPTDRKMLEQLAFKHNLTLASFATALFSAVLSKYLNSSEFRLSVPVFYREPLVENVEHIIGDFANTVILPISVDRAASLKDLCRSVQAELMLSLNHSAYPGVSVMRDLSRALGEPVINPVVFTAALNLPGKNLFSHRVRDVFGDMTYAVSQGAGVALDAQFAAVDDGYLINWDVRHDLVPADWLCKMFKEFVALVKECAYRPERLDEPLYISAEQAVQNPRPMNGLQQAYLAGRSSSLPLGGVAMQEFREYRGQLDLSAFTQRLAELIKQHECLRTLVDPQDQTTLVKEWLDTPLNLVDYSSLEREQALRRIETMREDYAHGLSDFSGPLWNVTVFKLPKYGDEDEFVVFIRFDAMIVDGRSISILMNDLFASTPIMEVKGTPAAPASVDAGMREQDSKYWQSKLADVSTAAKLPWLTQLSDIRRSRYARETLVVKGDSFKLLSRKAAQAGLFKNTILTATVLATLSAWSDENSLCVGLPVALHNDECLDNKSTFIAVKWDNDNAPFIEKAKRLQSDVAEGLDHLNFSGSDIARLLYHQINAIPVLPIVITNGLSWSASNHDAPMRLMNGLTQTPQVAVDIRFSMNSKRELVFDVDFARDAIHRETIADFLTALEKAIIMLEHTSQLSLNPDAFFDPCHYVHNDAEENVSGHHLERIAANIFNKENRDTALIYGDNHKTYDELGLDVRSVIGGLQKRGLARGSVVAVCLPRGFQHTTFVIACALTGIIWVPIDASAPPERLNYLLDNAGAELVVSEDLLVNFNSVRPSEIFADETEPDSALSDLNLLSSSEEPAYYLYTSGTTGKPKCVVLSNRATANVIENTLEDWSAGPEDVFISVTPLHHDMSIFDIFGALTIGAAIVLPEPGEEKNAVRWNQLVAKHQVTIWCSVPAILEMLLACRREGQLKSLRLVAQGGDYIKPAVVAELRNLLPNARLISLGGPTETTIWSIWHEIAPHDLTLIPYGKPLPKNRYFILNECGHHCPSGVVGRIYTAGTNVALGYLDHGELVQTDFVTITDETGRQVRAFRTGDRGRYRRDGIIEFDSRVSGYVKIRGVRVSLPDIENVLIQHSLVRTCMVAAIGAEKQGEASLAALCVTEPGSKLTQALLRDFLGSKLPHSHVPSLFVFVDELPLSRNGKPDRRLAKQIVENAGAGHTSAAGTVWADDRSTAKILKIYLQTIGKDDGLDKDETSDLIKLGIRPHHLKLVSEKIKSQMHIELSPMELMRCRNVKEVSKLVRRATSRMAAEPRSN